MWEIRMNLGSFGFMKPCWWFRPNDHVGSLTQPPISLPADSSNTEVARFRHNLYIVAVLIFDKFMHMQLMADRNDDTSYILSIMIYAIKPLSATDYEGPFRTCPQYDYLMSKK
jgi:hypothetical protein